MIHEFEVDCGEVLGGHRLLATGLRLDGTSDDAVHADYSEHRPDKPVHPMMSLTYVIVPGLDSTTLRGREVDAEIHIEPPADPAWWHPDRSWGAERDAVEAAATTAGAFGPFIVPVGTRSVTVDLFDIGVTTDDTPPDDDGPPRALGSLHINLERGSVSWRSAG